MSEREKRAKDDSKVFGLGKLNWCQLIWRMVQGKRIWGRNGDKIRSLIANMIILRTGKIM